MSHRVMRPLLLPVTSQLQPSLSTASASQQPCKHRVRQSLGRVLLQKRGYISSRMAPRSTQCLSEIGGSRALDTHITGTSSVT